MAVGLVKGVLGLAFIGFGVTILLALADGLTTAIITQSWGSTAAFTEELAKVATFQAPGGDALVLIFGLVGVLATLLLFVEMLIRGAGIFIVTATAPIGAAGLVLPETAGWWRKLVSAELALIFVKPIIALVYALGFTALNWAGGPGHSKDAIVLTLTGLLILAAAAVAPFAVAKLFSFYDGQIAQFGAAGLLGPLAGAGAMAAVGTRSMGNESLGATMEQASDRSSSLESPAPSLGDAGAGQGGGAAGAAAAAGGAEAGGAAGGGAGGGAAAAAGPAGMAAMAALEAGKAVKDAGPNAIKHAGDLAGMDNGGSGAGGGSASPSAPGPATPSNAPGNASGSELPERDVLRTNEPPPPSGEGPPSSGEV